MKSRPLRIASFVLVVVVIAVVWRASRPNPQGSTEAAPTIVAEAESLTREMTMSEVLEMARDARQYMAETLDDYTARFVKQEVDTNGVLGEVTELEVKVQTTLRGDGDEAPMRVYLKFVSPEAVAGREVIWAADLNDGKMAVHETYFPLKLQTLWLDPNGFLAMQGQRYPISEIGLVRLVEKLIERGETDRDNPDVSVTLTREYKIDQTEAELIQVKRSKPGGGEDDFSLAEIVIDPEKKLILSFRSFGWPEAGGDGTAPLLESYTYHDVQTNVGLTEEDFDPSNSTYGFP